MKSPTRDPAVIRRQVTRARRDGVMVTLHPDTVTWLALLAAARKNCVLEPEEAKTAIRLLGVLQDHLEGEIDTDRKHAKGRVRDAKRKWKAAEDLIKTLTGVREGVPLVAAAQTPALRDGREWKICRSDLHNIEAPPDSLRANRAKGAIAASDPKSRASRATKRPMARKAAGAS